jgi:AP-3 complex subunit delta
VEEIVPFLSDRLKDSDKSVKMTAISTIYEISKIDQSLFVVTIPVLYQLFGEVNNNWVLIKIIKLLTEFCKVEPRLKMKLRPKFYDLLESQRAKSVQYEIIKSSLVLYKDM